MITIHDLEEMEEYLASGTLEKDFEDGSESRKYEILELLEKIMDLAELADEKATRLIFKDSYLAELAGVKLQK